jgi:hypothetical protein
MVSSGLRTESGRLGGAMSPAGDQLHAPAQVVAQVHHANLIFVTNPTDASVINASEGFFHERKGMFNPRTGLGLAVIGELLPFGQRGRRTAVTNADGTITSNSCYLYVY